MVCVPAPEAVCLSRLSQMLSAVLAQRFQQPISKPVPRAGLRHNQ